MEAIDINTTIFSFKQRQKVEYDVTLYQTPRFGQAKGYEQVYRLNLLAKNHEELLNRIFSMFNVSDLIPNDYHARFIGTGDIIFIDEGRKGNTYYKLTSHGWKKINRVYMR